MYPSMTVYGWSDMVDLIRKREVLWRQTRSRRADDSDGSPAPADAASAAADEIHQPAVDTATSRRTTAAWSHIPG